MYEHYRGNGERVWTKREVRPRPNLVPRAFLRRGEDGREKTLASADHVTNLNITFPTNLC